MKELEENILNILLNTKGISGRSGISTYDICRRINSVKNRRFCHKFRKEQPKKNQPNSKFKGALDPTGDCSNDTQNCCQASFRDIYNVLRNLERMGKVESKRGKALDIKRFSSFVQTSKDIYRFWFAKTKESIKEN